MNTNILQGEWKQLKGKVRQQWARLTEDDLDRIQGNVEVLHGRLQELYGRTSEQVRSEVDAWLAGAP